MNIDNLVIEVTRKCNLQCEHCCRGNAQRKILDFKKLALFLKVHDLGYINSLTIGGGEPSLAKTELEELLYAFRYSGINVGNLFVVTNGKNTPQWLLDWYIKFTNDICDNNELSAFTFSFDKWHNYQLNNTQLRKRNSHFYYAQEYIENCTGKNQVYKHSDEKWNENHIIAMGRAKEWGNKILKPEKIEIDGEIDAYIEDTIYFTVDGLLFSNCDLSYQEMNRKSKFYITNCEQLKTSNLFDSIENYNKQFKIS